MWLTFGNSSISMREVVIASIYKDLTRKTNFFEFNGLGMVLDLANRYYSSVAKTCKEKLVGGLLFANPIVNRVGKRLHWGFILSRAANLQPATLLKKRLLLKNMLIVINEDTRTIYSETGRTLGKLKFALKQDHFVCNC